MKADELLARNIVLTMWMNGLLMASILLKRTHPCLTRPLRLRRRRWSLVVVVFLLVQDFWGSSSSSNGDSSATSLND